MIPAGDGLPVLAFVDSMAWEAWLAMQVEGCAGVWLKLAKKGTSTLTRVQAVVGAPDHGWIYGQVAADDGDRSLVRFTPRRARSRCSEKNRLRAGELLADGRVAPSGLREIERAKTDGRWEAAYPPASTASVPDDLAAALDAQPAARAFFDKLTNSSRYAVLLRIHEAKRAITRAARIERFVAMCAAGQTSHDAARGGRTVTEP